MLTRTKPTVDALHIRQAAYRVVGKLLNVPMRPVPTRLIFCRYKHDVVSLDEVYDGGPDALDNAAITMFAGQYALQWVTDDTGKSRDLCEGLDLLFAAEVKRHGGPGRLGTYSAKYRKGLVAVRPSPRRGICN